MKNFFTSLQTKLFLFCLILSLILSLLLSLKLYQVLSDSFKEQQFQSSSYNLNLIAENVERDLDTLYQTVLFCSTNNEISHFLSDKDNHTYTSYPVSMTAYEQLRIKIFNSPIESFINKMILCSNQDDFLIFGKNYGLNTDVSLAQSQPWFQEILSEPDYKWIGLTSEPFASSSSATQALPVVRPVSDSMSGKIAGWLYLSLDSSIVSQKINTDLSSFYWIIDQQTYVYKNGRFEKTDAKISFEKENLAKISLDDITVSAVFSQLENAPWTFVQTLPDSGTYISHISFFKNLLPFLGLLLLCLLIFSFVLKKIVSDPTQRLCLQLQKISEGNFYVDPSLETADEFGFIGKSINDMSQNISTLISKLLAAEAEKRQLELDSLQNQISPHFLYNTLYTIKWMAILQKVPGIAEMLDSLSQIMKTISKNTDSKISLRDELCLLNHYITILKYRYGNSFSYAEHIQDTSLLDCSVFKFSLQPLIENAVFHGLGSKQSAGQIQLTVFRKDSDLIISITDNGIGISPEQAKAILETDTYKNENKPYKKIGLKNINKRLQLEYGKEYGLKIESELGHFTRIIIRYPFIKIPSISERKDV